MQELLISERHCGNCLIIRVNSTKKHKPCSRNTCSLPEQERTSLALEREKEAMEEQYLFLIEKKEENSLTLNSSSLPAKMVESPRVSAILASPHITKIAFLAILFGALLPFLVFFFDKYKKEFSQPPYISQIIPALPTESAG